LAKVGQTLDVGRQSSEIDHLASGESSPRKAQYFLSPYFASSLGVSLKSLPGEAYLVDRTVPE